MTDKFEFKAGDVVSFGGVRGVVTYLNKDATRTYTVFCRFDDESFGFTKDGRFHVDHTKPLLELIERPKKKVKKTFEGWVSLYSDIPHSSVHSVYPSKERAEQANKCCANYIACVKLTGEYEVEE